MNRSSGYSQDIGYMICGGDEPLLEAPALRLITCATSLPDSCQPPASRSHTTKWLPLWAPISLAGDYSGSPLMSTCSAVSIAFNVVADPRSSSAQVAEADSDPCRLVTHQLWPPLLTPWLHRRRWQLLRYSRFVQCAVMMWTHMARTVSRHTLGV